MLSMLVRNVILVSRSSSLFLSSAFQLGRLKSPFSLTSSLGSSPEPVHSLSSLASPISSISPPFLVSSSFHFCLLYLVVHTFYHLIPQLLQLPPSRASSLGFSSQPTNPSSVLYKILLIPSSVPAQSPQCFPLAPVPTPEEGWVVGYRP